MSGVIPGNIPVNTHVQPVLSRIREQSQTPGEDTSSELRDNKPLRILIRRAETGDKCLVSPRLTFLKSSFMLDLDPESMILKN